MNVFPLPDRQAVGPWLARLRATPLANRVGPVDRPLVLYGAGRLGTMAATLFARLGIPIAYAVDRRPPASGLLDGRIPVLTPEAVAADDRGSHRIAVCVVTAPYRPIHEDLVASGWRHVSPVYDVLEAYADRLPMANGWFADPIAPDEWSRLAAVLARWDDDRSRAAHLQFLAWRLAREEWTFEHAPVTIDDRYFIPPVLAGLGDAPSFLDAGAYHGGVIAQWFERVGARSGDILAVEADADNATRLRAWVATLPDVQADRVRIVECALAEASGRQPFAQGMGLAARLSADAAGEARTCRWDELDFDSTFAKLHLEGGELNALRGGLATLRRQRPILAITVYHHPDGLWRTAAFLNEALTGYRLLMRMHGWCGTGAVVYAIPDERWHEHGAGADPIQPVTTET